MASSHEPASVVAVTAAGLLRKRSVWAVPLVVAAVFVALMTLIYFGSIVDPAEHLHGLPVTVVDEDSGAATTTGRLDLGEQVVGALVHSSAVTQRLALTVTSSAGAEAEMDRGGAYATLLVPSTFTSSTLALLGISRQPGAGDQLPTVELLGNSRAGTLGVSLADSVLGPALAKVDAALGKDLAKTAAPGTDAALLASPFTVSEETYRPLPAHSGLGLSAFYIALLIMMCGFLGGVIINTFVDGALGYATSELGPWWRQRLPRHITRWNTLLVKWTIAVPGTLVLTGALLLVAAGILRMDAPGWFVLWMFAWFAAAVVAMGTLVLFAALGALGQFIAMLVFVYLALASSGGTIPLQALWGFFRFVASFEPLRQILGGVRSILYFNGAGDAGLDRGLVLTAIGFAFWGVAGVVVTKWYDHRGLYRLRPETLEYVQVTARAYAERGTAGAAGAAGAADADAPAVSGGDGGRGTSVAPGGE
ncbi:MAG TPA: DUF3533 domain-containing protein [Acidimicrobiales bacterium]|nr:DUF3533 domain-containing protein [Acidimicrobiales bacterium]